MHGWLAFIVAIGVLLLALAVAGVATFEPASQLFIALVVIAVVIAVIGAWLLFVALRAQYVKVKTGKEALIGAIGVATTELNPKGTVRVLGEFWEARAQNESIDKDEAVEVVDMDGMFLIVKKTAK